MRIIGYKQKQMNKYLPTSKISSNAADKGFTLIELLVVVAILAILGFIAISQFGNAQMAARDGRRRADIDTIAKSIEASRDLSINPASYSYSKTNYTKDFVNNPPKDPNVNGKYCYAASGTSTVGVPTTTDWASVTTCPTNPTAYSDFNGINAATSPTSITTATSWQVCALLESGNGSVYCKGNSF